MSTPWRPGSGHVRRRIEGRVEGPSVRSAAGSAGAPTGENEPVRFAAVIAGLPITVELVVGHDEESMGALRPLMGRWVSVTIETVDDGAVRSEPSVAPGPPGAPGPPAPLGPTPSVPGTMQRPDR